MVIAKKEELKVKSKGYYTTFQTQWGWFGLAGFHDGLTQTCLPAKNKEMVHKTLSRGFEVSYDPAYQKEVQEAVKEYFEGVCIDFGRVPVCLHGLTEFQNTVLNALRNITYGNTITYNALAQRAYFPNASRAVGRALAANPLPLIIPCHRVIRSDGSLGGFSAQGGIRIKQRLLTLERSPATV